MTEKLAQLKEFLGSKINSVLIILPEGKRNLWPLILIVLMVVAIPIAAYLVQTRQIFRPKATSDTIKLYFGRNWDWAASYNFGSRNLNENFPVDIYIIAGNHSITGVDIEVLYDNYLSTTGEFTVDGGNFDNVLIPSNRRSSVGDRGKIRFAAVKKEAVDVKSGTFLLGTINLRTPNSVPETVNNIHFGRVQIIESGSATAYGTGDGETRVELGEATYAIAGPTSTPGPSVTPTPTDIPGAPGRLNISMRASFQCLSSFISHPTEGFDISWTSPASPVDRVEISTNDNFLDDAGSDFFYRKQIGGGITSTSGPKGFLTAFGVTGSLNITPDTTFYVRVHNTGGNSPVANFSIPACPAATATSTPTPTSTTPARADGDADDNRCVDTRDLDILLDEIAGRRTTKCADWSRNGSDGMEDFNIWYPAWIYETSHNPNVCPQPPANNCASSR